METHEGGGEDSYIDTELCGTPGTVLRIRRTKFIEVKAFDNFRKLFKLREVL